MHIYSRKNPAKVHPDPIWSNGALGLFKEAARTKSSFLEEEDD